MRRFSVQDSVQPPLRGRPDALPDHNAKLRMVSLVRQGLFDGLFGKRQSQSTARVIRGVEVGGDDHQQLDEGEGIGCLKCDSFDGPGATA